MNNNLDEYPLRAVYNPEDDYPPPHPSNGTPRSPERIRQLMEAEEACRRYVAKILKRKEENDR
jgi:hypothetical protein